MVSTYGIQTNDGIYEIKQLTADSLPSKVDPPACLQGRRITVYNTCDNTEETHPVTESLKLLKLAHQITFDFGGSFFEGYLRRPDYQPSLVLLDNGEQKEPKLSFDLNKTVFEWVNDVQLRIVSSNKDMGEKYYIDTLKAVHPIFEKSSKFTPVYKTFDQSVGNLKMLCTHDQSDAKDELLTSMITSISTNDSQTAHNHPFIVIEGLDATGKSTMSVNLAKYLNANIMTTPPASVKHIRKEFDVYSELCRRSFFAYSNYLAAEEIRELLKEKMVVLDRYWHSTTAYSIAKDAGDGIDKHLPPPGDDLYKWPEDLLKPSAIIFLKTKEGERDRRMMERDEVSAEEMQLKESSLFRNRILEVYRRIGFGDRWIEVDTGGTREESLMKAIDGLKRISVI